MSLYVRNNLATIGQQVTAFDGEKFTLVGWSEPKHAGSTGRVIVENKFGHQSEFFPGVIGGAFKKESEAFDVFD